MLKEFRAFIMRGNVLDLAVAVIIGAAFSKIVTSLTDPAAVANFERAQNAVTLSLQRLQEAYPELRSQGNYTTLMSQLEGTENRIAISRNDYNQAVQAYNTRIRTFPDAVGAKIFYGAKPITPFQATTPGAETAPQVNFGNTN
ncbi:MAG: hypothetical protein EOP68_09555 [Sphingomonas sp.]|nr:MAG: hypothetical protein EOP68_09555 [Sphingomonas sp.]